MAIIDVGHDNRQKPPVLSIAYILRNVLAITAAITLGVLVNEIFTKYVRINHNLWTILFQITVIIVVITLVEAIAINYLEWNIVNNIYFVSIFLGLQRNLFARLDRIKFLNGKVS